MKINLKQLFSIVGEVRDFSYELAADELGFVKGLEFGAPVKIEGRLYNRAGGLSQLHGQCLGSAYLRQVSERI